MGLGAVVGRLAISRVHVLILEIPGWPMLRMHAQAAITARGWVLAEAPADADVLLVVGETTDSYVEIADAIWNQIPGPRHRTRVDDHHALTELLDSLPLVLGDQQQQVADARQPRRAIGPDEQEHARMDHEAHGGEDDGHGEMQHDASGGHDHGDMDMDMDMSGPAGIPLASGDESDRDDLEMDITHLTLGPLLPHWPAGLVLHCTLQGDVIGEVTIESLRRPKGAEPTSGPLAMSMVRAVELCDAAGNFLSVAGWDPVAAKLCCARDMLLNGATTGEVAPRLQRVSRQLARSRTLRWSLAGIPTAEGTDARSILLGWVCAAAALLEERPVALEDARWPTSLRELSEAMIGQELSVARIIVACIEPSRIGKLMEPRDG